MGFRSHLPCDFGTGFRGVGTIIGDRQGQPGVSLDGIAGDVGTEAEHETKVELRGPAEPNWQPWLLFFLRAVQQQKRRLAASGT